MEVIDSARMYARFAWRLVRYLRTPWTAEEADREIRAKLHSREARFLHVLRQQVYGNPRSPYARLLEWAGWELEDVAAHVRADGLEETLRALYRSGVYVSFEEYKGHAPIRRGSQELVVKNADFDNLRGRPDFFSHTSGSSGSPVRVPMYLDELTHRALSWAILPRGMNLKDYQSGLLMPIGGTGINVLLILIKAGMRPKRWFSITDPALPGLGFRYRWSGQLLSTWSALLGNRLPKPEPVDLRKLDPVVRWCRDAGPLCLIALPSSAVRLAIRAVELGIALPETYLFLGGEPLTAERRAAIAESGARVGGLYATIDAGTVGWGCLRTDSGEADDYHVLMEDFAVTTAPRDRQTGSPLLLTCFIHETRKVFINVELGDTGEIHEGHCGCYFEDLGLRQHLTRVRSVGKLTAEGMTVLKSDVAHLIEAVLPQKIGGRPTDFQLVQRPGPDNLAILELWVSPNVNHVDDAMVVSTFLDELARLEKGYRIVADIWGKGGTVRVVRSQPMAVAGKSPAVRIETE